MSHDHQCLRTENMATMSSRSRHEDEESSTDLGFEVDDDFIKEQIMILERIEQQRVSLKHDQTEVVKLSHEESRVPPIGRHSEAPGLDLMSCEFDNQELEAEHPDVACLSTSDRINREAGTLYDVLRSEDRQDHCLQADGGEKRVSVKGDASPIPFVHEPASASEGAENIVGKDTTSKLLEFNEDIVKVLSNGKKLRLKGTRHAYDAVRRGTAVVVSCAGCFSLLQVPASSTAVYCGLCHQVTPMELAQSLPASNDQDEDVAIVLQRQELDMACARKMVKYRNEQE